MTDRTIRLPSGRSVTIRAYVAAWRALRDAPSDATLVNGWSWFPVPAFEVLDEMRAAIHDRINRRGALKVRHSRAPYAAYARARAPRVRIEPNCGARFSPAARRALAHRIHAYEE